MVFQARFEAEIQVTETEVSEQLSEQLNGPLRPFVSPYAAMRNMPLY